MKWLIAIFGLALCGQTLSVEKERALGEGMMRQWSRFEQAEVAAYVERLGARLGSGFRIVMTADEKGEPFGLPGQILMVPAGFLLAVEDEAEFAGMLAHAMGHSVLRHGVIEQPQAEPGKIPLIYVMPHPMEGQLVLMMTRSRMAGYEAEADRYGADAAMRAGFDASGLARYLRRSAAGEERLAALATAGADGGEVSSSEFLRVREIVRTALAAPSVRKPTLRKAQSLR